MNHIFHAAHLNYFMVSPVFQHADSARRDTCVASATSALRLVGILRRTTGQPDERLYYSVAPKLTHRLHTKVRKRR